MKDTSRYPLYPKTGIHWSYYGEVLVQDSLIEYLTDLTSLNLGSLKIDSLSRTPANESNDNDIEKSMNLLFDIPNLNMIYPHYHLEKGEDNIRGLVVADSYYWGIFNKGFSKYFLNQGQFWYYNESIHQLGKPNRKVEEVSLKDEIEKHEVIIILTTDVNLYQFSFGFIDELYELYDVPKEQEYKELVDMYIKRINGTPSWKEKVKQQAEENGKDLDQMILENAQYMVWIATKPQ